MPRSGEFFVSCWCLAKLICFRIAVSALLLCLLLKWKPTFPSQLTAVKVEHPLTSSGWSYRKLRCTAHRFEVFLEEFRGTKHVDYIKNPKGSSLTLFRPYPSITSKPFMIRPLILHKIMYLSFPTFKRSLINTMTSFDVIHAILLNLLTESKFPSK